MDIVDEGKNILALFSSPLLVNLMGYNMNISVLMSVYAKERPENLKECLASLDLQTLRAAEVVLVEDGPISSDLKAVIEEYRKLLNIRSIALRQNMGLAFALNRGLEQCGFDLVVRMDSDDIALPERFEIQAKFMMENPDLAASSGSVEEFDQFSGSTCLRVLPTFHDDLIVFARRRSPLSHPAAIIRRSVVLKVGGYPYLPNAQDYGLWALLIVRGYKIANVSKVLVRMRAGPEMLKRRGLRYFWGEVKLLRYQYKIGFISFFDLVVNSFVRFGLRISPLFLRRFLYKNSR